MKYKLLLSFVSPIHIGSGEEIDPLNYILKDDYFYFFEPEEILSTLEEKERKNFLTLAKNIQHDSLKKIRNFFKERVKELDAFKKVSVSSSVKSIYEEKFYDWRNRLEVNPFIKTMDKPYIPGSSLKGAIRTALLNYWAEDMNHIKTEEDILRAKTYDRRRDRWRKDITKDVFKLLKVPDIPFSNNFTQFAKISNFKITDNKLEETGIQIIKEITNSRVYNFKKLSPNDFEFPLEIIIEEEKINNVYVGRRDLSFTTLWESLDFYEKIFKNEKNKWSKYSVDLKNFYDMFDRFLETSRKNFDIKLIKIGFGSGLEAITVEKIRDRNLQYGKSINLVEGKYPLGWAILRKNLRS